MPDNKMFKRLIAFGKKILGKAMGIKKKKKKTKPGAVDDNAMRRVKDRNTQNKKTLQQLSSKANRRIRINPTGLSPADYARVEHQIKSGYKKVGLKY